MDRKIHSSALDKKRWSAAWYGCECTVVSLSPWEVRDSSRMATGGAWGSGWSTTMPLYLVNDRDSEGLTKERTVVSTRSGSKWVTISSHAHTRACKETPTPKWDGGGNPLQHKLKWGASHLYRNIPGTKESHKLKNNLFIFIFYTVLVPLSTISCSDKCYWSSYPNPPLECMQKVTKTKKPSSQQWDI